MAQIKPKLKYTVIFTTAIFASLFLLRVYYQKTHEEWLSYFGFEVMKPETFIDLGKAAEAGSRYNDALEFYQLGIKYFPENTELWMRLADVQMKLGDEEKAIESLKRLIELVPLSADLQFRIAILYFSISKFPEAYLHMQKAYSLNPENDDYLYKLAQLANLNKQYGIAYELFKKLSQIHPSKREFEFALAKTRAWAKETPPKDHTQILLEEATSSFEKNNEKRGEDFLDQYAFLFGMTQSYQRFLAERVYLNMARKKPSNSETFYRLAQFYYRYNQPWKGLDAIHRALALQQQNMDYLSLYVLIAHQLGLVQEEKKAYQAILSIKPYNEEALNKLILFYIDEKTGLTAKQVESEPLLFKIAKQDYEGDVIGALETLEAYGKQEAQNPLYQAMLSYLAGKMDGCMLQYVCDINKLNQWVKNFTLISSLQFGESLALQNKAQLVARKLICLEPCCPKWLDLYATALRIHEDPPFVDLVAAQRTYCRILQIDPCNQTAFRNLAKVTALLGETDKAACLYNQYIHTYPPSKEVLIEFAGLLEDQGNIGLALRYLNLYEACYGKDRYLQARRAHILNSGELSTPAVCLAQEILEDEPCNYDGWLNYTNATAILNYPYHSLYGLDQLEVLQPGNPATGGARWTVWPPLLHYGTLSGRFYRESTTLTEYFERLDGSYALCPDFRIEAGTEWFQTHVRTEFNPVLGLGNLRGINGEAWGSETSAYLGINRLVNPKLNVDLRVGAGSQRVGDIYSWTPTYLLNVLMPLRDSLDIDFLSSYGFMLISPRNLSLKIRQWRNFLTVDWQPRWGCQLLTTLDALVNTDGNKQIEAYIYPRKTVCYRRHWKIDVGLMGTWLASHKSRQTGYYQPHLYQAYAGDVFVEYKIDDLNAIRTEGTLGIQKDTFNTRFGFLGDIQLEGLFNITMNWYLYLFGEYYYLDTSQGPFSYVDLAGGLTYRF